MLSYLSKFSSATDLWWYLVWSFSSSTTVRRNYWLRYSSYYHPSTTVSWPYLPVVVPYPNIYMLAVPVIIKIVQFHSLSNHIHYLLWYSILLRRTIREFHIHSLVDVLWHTISYTEDINCGIVGGDRWIRLCIVWHLDILRCWHW